MSDDSMELTLQITAATDPVSRFRFLDASGQELAARRTSSSSMQLGGTGSIRWTYGCKQKAETATIEVTLWQDLTEVTVPVKFAFGVGM